jgi:hypothetical protein
MSLILKIPHNKPTDQTQRLFRTATRLHSGLAIYVATATLSHVAAQGERPGSALYSSTCISCPCTEDYSRNRGSKNPLPRSQCFADVTHSRQEICHSLPWYHRRDGRCLYDRQPLIRYIVSLYQRELSYL